MKRIRIGNTIRILYSIFVINGEDKIPENFTGVDVKVVLKNKYYGTTLKVDYQVYNNIVDLTIPGNPLLYPGIYNLAIFYTKEGIDYAIDTDAFELVKYSREIGGSTCCPDLDIQTVEISSEIEYSGGGSITQIQSNWAETDIKSPSYIQNKPTIPTKNSELINDSDYATISNITEKISDHNISDSSHVDIRDILKTCIGLPVYDPGEYKITFTSKDGATLEIDLPIEQMGLSYNAETKVIQFENADGTLTSIPVSDFISEYIGSIGNEIQISIESGNKITAKLLDGSITKEKLSSALVAIIDGKADSEDIPKKVSQLENDSFFITQNELSTQYYTKSQIDEIIAAGESYLLDAVNPTPTVYSDLVNAVMDNKTIFVSANNDVYSVAISIQYLGAEKKNIRLITYAGKYDVRPNNSVTFGYSAIITSENVVNSLDGDNIGNPLSSVQGKVLNDKLGVDVIEDIDHDPLIKDNVSLKGNKRNLKTETQETFSLNIPNATESSAGGMSPEDKQKVDAALIFKDVTTVTTLTNLPPTNYSIKATLSAASPISFAETPTEGEEYMIDILNSGSADFDQPLPNADNCQSNETSVTCPAGKVTAISVRYIHGKYVFRV